jgi:hypothetical protein
VLDVPRVARDASAQRVCAPWSELGRGVSVKRCTGARAHVAVLMAGWNITMPSTQAWADALDRAALASRGVSTLYAVQGPEHVDFRGKEIAVNALLEDLTHTVHDDAWVLVAAHSSGAFVAATLFDRAFRQQRDRYTSLRGRAVYVNLDGDRGIERDPERALSSESVAGLRHVVFVSTHATEGALRGFSMDAMRDGHAAFPDVSALLEYDAGNAGCSTNVCAHLALINTRPYPRGNASYARFEQGPVNTVWLEFASRWLR